MSKRPARDLTGMIRRFLERAGVEPEAPPLVFSRPSSSSGDEFGWNERVLRLLPQAIIVTDTHGLITFFSPGAEAMLGYSADEVVGKKSRIEFHDPDEIRRYARALTKKLGHPVASNDEAFLAAVALTDTPKDREWIYARKDGEHLHVLLSLRNLRDVQGRLVGLLSVATDITERSQMAKVMMRRAYYDHLTHLPNRRLFMDRLRMALAQARRKDERLALLMIDLDNFKPVNDQFGHHVGDALLKGAARNMQRCLRMSDTLARVGGDEFVAILPGMLDDRDTLNVAEKLRDAINTTSTPVESYAVAVACSIGVAIFPEHGSDEKSLLHNADDAMYEAKKRGRNCVQFYREALGRRVTEWDDSHAGLPILRLVWRRAYQYGEPSIDREHQQLFEHANELINLLMEGQTPGGDLLKSIDRLLASVVAHFSNEEKVLAICQYTDLEYHAAQHRQLVGEAGRLREKAVAGKLSFAETISFLVRNVVVEHMLSEDRKYLPVLQAMRSPSP